MSHTSSGETAEQRFWRWFTEHEETIFTAGPEQERVLSAVAGALLRVHPDLTFELGPPGDGPREFVISADGIKAAFPAVHALADAAPSLARWRITRFRPRRSGSGRLRMGDTAVSTDQVFVAVEPHGDKLGLTLFIEGYRPTPDDIFEQIGYLLLDRALGEYDVETRIGYIEFQRGRPSGRGALVPLAELPGIVDRFLVTRPGRH